MPTYPGGKGGAGTYQTIINQMPPHQVYIEPFAGGAAVFRHKRAAEYTILCEANPIQAGGDTAFGLFEEREVVGVFVVSTLIRENVATRPDLNRSNTVELSRVVAARPGICRLLVRMFREHSGDLYRFDGWAKVATSRSGPDGRSGRKGRSKVIWGWPAAEILTREPAAVPGGETT